MRRLFIFLLIVLGLIVVYRWGQRGLTSQLITHPAEIGQKTSRIDLKSFMGEESVPAPGLMEAEKEVGEAAPEEEAETDRMVIKNGYLSLLVKNTLQAVEEAKKAATEFEGFVLSSRTWYADAQKEEMKGEVILKVPSERFDEALSRLKDLALKVVSEQTSGQDVTEEYVDLESRLKNLEATEAQLREIMKRSGQISEILEVQRELTRVRGQIEQTKGRMKYLSESAKMATITAYIATEEAELPIVEEKWRPLKAAKAALRTLLRFWQSIANYLIWIVVFFSPFVVLFFLIWLVRKIRK